MQPTYESGRRSDIAVAKVRSIVGRKLRRTRRTEAVLPLLCEKDDWEKTAANVR